MAHVIAAPCIGKQHAECVIVCPVDCIHTTLGADQYFIDPDRCIGCGLCEAKCPVASPAAIRVTRAGESRDPKSGFTLGRPS